MKIRPDRWPAFLLVVAVLLTVFIVIKIARSATGESVTLTWEHPTNYTDGAPLASADIRETLIVWRRPINGVTVGEIRIPAPITSARLSGLDCGSYAVSAATVTQAHEQSAEAGPVLYATGVGCPPNPPTNVIAYQTFP